jgi:hypothetical protein
VNKAEIQCVYLEFWKICPFEEAYEVLKDEAMQYIFRFSVLHPTLNSVYAMQ